MVTHSSRTAEFAQSKMRLWTVLPTVLKSSSIIDLSTLCRLNMIYDYIKRVSAAKTLGENTSYRVWCLPNLKTLVEGEGDERAAREEYRL